MIDFTKIPNIHYWTQRVLPLVFDESLSYVEKINKLEFHVNELINEYNTFGQNVVSEINTFEEETTNQINTFIQQVTNEINQFKDGVMVELEIFTENITNQQNNFESRITNQQNTFETSMTNKQNAFEARILQRIEDFETTINNSINAMQEVVNNIPNIIEEKVNTLTMPYLQENVPSLVQQVISEKALTSLSELDTKDLNTLTVGIVYSFINSDGIENKPTKLESGSFCIVYTFKPRNTINSISQRLVVCSGDTLGKSYYRKSEAGVFPTTDTWVEETEKYISVTPSSVTDLNTLNANTIYCTYLNTETFTNYPSDIPNNSYINVMTSFKDSTKTLRIQYAYILFTPNNSNKIGSFRYRMEMIAGRWSSWNGINNENLIINKTTTSIDANSLNANIIVTCDSASGAVNTNLPNSNLTTGHYYIQTIKNSDTEILQYLYNTGDYGANIYSRQKNGSSWSVWRAIAPNVRYEETTNFTVSSTMTTYENYYPTTISTIGLPDENIFDGFEVQAIVNIDGKSSNPTPMLYNANLVYNANSPNVITIGFKVFDFDAQAGKYYVKFRVLDWR